MSKHLDVLVLTKRQYTNKDLLDDRYGRIREIPLQLSRRGHRVYGLCLSYRKRNTGLVRDEGVVWESINAGPIFLGGLARFLLTALNRIREADVVWACSDSFYGVIACALGRLMAVPVVFDLYDNFEFFISAKIPILRQLYHWAIRQSDALTCVSIPLARLMQSYGRRHDVYVLENAVRLDLFKPAERELCRAALGLPIGVPVIGTAGALTRSRGLHHLLEAFQRLRLQNQPVHLALAGPRDPLVLIPDDPAIHYLGDLQPEQVPTFLNALDVAVICNLPNDFGLYCFPQKAREIMACNIPLVAAKVGSMAELLGHRPEWLYSPTDPATLVDCLDRRLLDRRTDYGPIPDWAESASVLEMTLHNVCRSSKMDTASHRRR